MKILGLLDPYLYPASLHFMSNQLGPPPTEAKKMLGAWTVHPMLPYVCGCEKAESFPRGIEVLKSRGFR